MSASLFRGLSFGLLVGCLAMMTGCNTTKATLDTTGKFTMSTSPDDLFTGDGLVKEQHKTTLFTAIAYDNLQQDMARGQGEYLASLGVLMGVPAEQQQGWARSTQGRFARIFASDPSNTDEFLARLRRE